MRGGEPIQYHDNYDEDSSTSGIQTVESIEVGEELDFPITAQGTIESLHNLDGLVEQDFRRFKKELLSWLYVAGKDPHRNEGYSEATIKVTHYEIEDAYRWLWDREGEYTTTFTLDDANELIDDLVKHTVHPDTVVRDFQKAIKRLFAFLRQERNRQIREWDLKEETEIKIQPKKNSRDHLKDKFYSRNAMTYRKKRSATADMGLRPIEVERATEDWPNLERGKMVIPKDESTKNDASWVCDLSAKSVNALSHWMEERACYEVYDEKDALWLTEQQNRWTSQSLNYVLNKLMDMAEIDQSNRDLSYYSF